MTFLPEPEKQRIPSHREKRKNKAEAKRGVRDRDRVSGGVQFLASWFTKPSHAAPLNPARPTGSLSLALEGISRYDSSLLFNIGAWKLPG